MKTAIKKKRNFILSVLHEKCPNCTRGHVFVQNTGLLHLPIMNKECEVCHYHFDREPGYFLGAMYLSYGFAVLQGILTFLICHYSFPSMSTIWKALLVIAVIILLGKKNYKLSRILYIHIFPW